MEPEASWMQKFLKITEGAFNHLGFEVLSDYGRVFIPWMNISHIFLVIFERASKGHFSLYLLILQKNTDRIYYLDGTLANYKEMLGGEITENSELNLKLALRKIIPNLFEAYIEPSLFAFLKGSSHVLKRFSNLKSLGEFCEEIRKKKSDENIALEEGLLWDFSMTEKQKLFSKRRQDSHYLFKIGFDCYVDHESSTESVPPILKNFITSKVTPADYFILAKQIDPYYHLPWAGISLCEYEKENMLQALTYFKYAVDCIPYPSGLSEEHIGFYEELFRRMKGTIEESDEFLFAFERLIGFSPHVTFTKTIISLYESMGISPGWYENFLKVFSLISKESYIESFEPIEKTLNLYPRFPWTYHWQGVVLARMGRSGEAQRSFEKVLEKIKFLEGVTCSNTYTEMYLIKKNRKDKCLLDLAYQSNPLSSWTNYLLGNYSIYYEKNYTKGRYYFLKSLCMNPSGPLVEKICAETVKIQSQAPELSVKPQRKELQRGDYLGDIYQITQVFKGGMGIVYIVYEPSTDLHYAVKTFQEQFLWDRSIIKMFIREAETWIKLDRHINIVQAKFIKIFSEKPYLFLEFIRGTDLEKLIQKGPLSINEALDLSIQFCNGMCYTYNKLGIVHRDIKPSNCLITEDKVLKITDFGLARIFSDRTQKELGGTADALPNNIWVTSTNTFLGTIPYMAPERLLYLEPGDIRSDIYSFGAMFYEMVTGKLPHDPESLVHDFNIVTYPPVPLYKIDEKIPVELSMIVSRCLAQKPEERYGDFEELKSNLIQFYERSTSRRYQIEGTTLNITPEELLSKGNSLLSIGYYDEALCCFEQVLNQNPDSIDALSGKSLAFLKLERFQDALSGFDKILRMYPDRTEVLRDKGIALMELDRIDDALKCFEKVLVFSPEDPVCWWKKGVISQMRGQQEDALRYFDKSLSFNPKLFSVWKDKGTLLAELRRFSESVESFDKALEINPVSMDVIIHKGYALLNMLKFQHALINFEKGLNLDDTNVDVLMGMAMSLEGLQRFQDALKLYEKILETNYCEQKALVRMARIYKATGDLEEALDIYRELHRIGQSDPEILLEEALVCKSLFYYEEANSCLKECLAVRPRDMHILSLIRQIEEEMEKIKSFRYEYMKSIANSDEISEKVERLSLEGKSREALSILNRALGLDPRSTKLYISKAKLLMRLGRHTEALITYDDALKFLPGNELITDEQKKMILSQDKKKAGGQKGLFKKIFSTGENTGVTAYELFIKGRICFYSGDLDKAIRYFEDSLKSEPENIPSMYYKGLVLRVKGDYDNALECFDSVLEQDDSLASVWCSRGEVEEKLGRLSECLSCYEKSIQQNPLNFSAWLNLIGLYHALGYTKKSLIYSVCVLGILEHQLEFDFENVVNQSRKAILEYLLGRLRDSTNTCDQALERNPDSYTALYTKALLNRTKKNYRQALRCFQKLCESYPDTLIPVIQIGYTFELFEDHNEALDYYDKVLKVFPMQEWTIYQKSLLLHKSGNTVEALRCLDDILEYKSQSTWLWKAKGLFLYSQGKEEEAMWCYKRAVEHNSADFTAQFNLAILLIKLGNPEDALQRIDYLLSFDPYNPEIWVLRGDCTLYISDTEDVELYYDKAIEIDSTNVEAMNHKAIAQYMKGDNGAALRTLEEALKKHPAHIFILNNYGFLLFQVGRRREAKEFIEKALSIEPRNELLLFNLAALLIIDDQLSEAEQIVNSILMVNARSLNGLVAKGFLCELMKMPQEAIDFYDQVIKIDPKNDLIHLYRGNTLFSMGKYDEAVRSYSQALKFQQNTPLLWLHKGIALLKLNRHWEAEQCFNQYRKLLEGRGDYKNPEELDSPLPYDREKVVSLKTMGCSLDIKKDRPIEIFRSVDFDFTVSDDFFVESSRRNT